MQNTPFFRPDLASLAKRFDRSPPRSNCPSCLWSSDLIPYPDNSSPTFPHGWVKSLFSPLWPKISHYLRDLLFPNPLLPWTADVFLSQDNSCGGGKIKLVLGKIKLVLGKAEPNSTSQFQAKNLLSLMFYKLYSQSPFKTRKPPKS